MEILFKYINLYSCLINELKDLYRLKKSDINKASEVLAKAFIDDPDLVKVIRDDERRLEKMSILFRLFVRFGILYGEVYSPSVDIEGVAVWNPSATKNITFIRGLRSGFMGVMSKITKEERSRFSTYGKEIDRYTRNMIDGKHWFLFIIGMDPKHQRKGYGKMLMGPML